MKVCSNQHSNDDHAKFCEHCGEALSEATKTSDSVTSDQDEPSSSQLDVLEPEVIVDSALDTDTDQSNTDDDPVSSDGDVTTDVDVLEPAIVSADDLDDDDDDTPQTFVQPALPIDDVIRDLRQWAEDNEVSGDPYVIGLTQAAKQRSDLGLFASIDPFEVLPEPTVKTSVFRRVIRGLSIVRNMLVFVPVGLTWMAISRATDAYRDWEPIPSTLPDGVTTKQVERNFLDFWTGGGEGALDSFWTLPHIAELDFYLILGIIALSFLISTLQTRCDTLELRVMDANEKQRTDLAIQIRRSLHGKREASPESIATSLADALADLNQTTRDMAEVAARLENATTGVQSLTPKLDALNDSASVFAHQTSQSIAMAVNSLVQSVDQLNNSVTGNITSVFESAVANLQEAGEQLARTSASVEYGTKLLKDDIESIRQGLRR
jgi:uncharacterized protein YukE